MRMLWTSEAAIASGPVASFALLKPTDSKLDATVVNMMLQLCYYRH